MNESTEEKAGLFGGKAAAVMAGIFLGAFVICAVLVGMDRVERTRLEAVLPQAVAAK